MTEFGFRSQQQRYVAGNPNKTSAVAFGKNEKCTQHPKVPKRNQKSSRDFNENGPVIFLKLWTPFDTQNKTFLPNDPNNCCKAEYPPPKLTRLLKWQDLCENRLEVWTTWWEHNFKWDRNLWSMWNAIWLVILRRVPQNPSNVFLQGRKDRNLAAVRLGTGALESPFDANSSLRRLLYSSGACRQCGQLHIIL